MAKISELTDGGSLLPTDYLIAVRSGGNVKVQADTINVDQIDLGDNERIRLGASQDLQIYHDSATSTNKIIGSFDVTGTVTADGLISELSTDTQGRFSGWSVVGANADSGAIELGQTSAYQGVISYSATGSTRFIFDNTYGSAASTFEFRTNTSTTPKTHLKIDGSGDISFYEDTGTTPKLFWDASAESLGIGTTSPGRLLELYGTSNPALRLHNGTDTTDIGIATSAGAIATSSLNGALVISRNGANAINLATNGNVRATIDSSGSVGIGRTPLNKQLEVEGTTSNYNTMLVADSASGTTGTGGGIGFQSDNGLGTNVLVAAIQGIKENSTAGDQSGALVFVVKSPSPHTVDEVMRTSSSGKVFIGKTSDNDNTAGHTLHQSGLVVHTRDQAFTTIFNRTTNVGDIVQFKQDGALVGSIGVINSDNLTISGAVSNHTGIEFGTAVIAPMKSGVANDGGVDLGFSNARWKDLYLSGGVYVGGTGAANKLDDYEEGTWTPVFKGSTTAGTYTYTTQAGRYVKVGNLVTVWCTLTDITASSAGTGDIVVGGLPFTIANLSTYERAPNGGTRIRQVATGFTAQPNAFGGQNSTDVYFLIPDGTSDIGVSITTYYASNMDIGFTLTYEAA